jgi:hypothetical protein
MTTSLLKVLIVVAELVLTFVFLINEVIKKDRKRIKKSGIVFISIWILILAITIIEFVLI